jgi:carbon storage regulator
MLVLTRHVDENVLIGDQEITIKVLEIRGGRVRLGIEAPRDMTIRRVDLNQSNAGHAPEMAEALV